MNNSKHDSRHMIDMQFTNRLTASIPQSEKETSKGRSLKSPATLYFVTVANVLTNPFTNTVNGNVGLPVGTILINFPLSLAVNAYRLNIAPSWHGWVGAPSLNGCSNLAFASVRKYDRLPMISRFASDASNDR